LDIEATAREWTTERLKKMGVTPTPEVAEQMVADLQESMEDRINAAILEGVPKHLYAEFAQSMDDGTMKAFLAENVPDTERRVREALEVFKREIVG
jgi:hypothetical protein